MARAPARGRSRRPSYRKRTRDRLWHLVDPGDMVTATARAPAVRARRGQEAVPAASGPVTRLRPGALTACCRRPVDQVHAVAISRDAVVEDGTIEWCGGVR